MGVLSDEKSIPALVNEKIQVKTDQIKDIDKLEKSSINSFTYSSDEYEGSIKGYVPGLKWTEEEEKRVLFKIDTRLMSFVLLMTFVMNMDRTNISNAISDNMPEELGFNITGVNTATLNYGGYLIIRIFIAITEAGFIPSCLLYFSTWYKASELATRLSWFWGIQSFASAFSGLISFGIFNLEGVAGLYGWKWLFLIDGIITQIVGFIAIFYLPASPAITKGLLRSKNGWFTEREASIAVTRIIEEDKYNTEQNVNVTWHDVKIALLDTKLWTHLLITFTSFMHTTPISTYLPKLITGYGFSVTTSNLLTVPANIINLVFSILIARSAEKRGYYAFHSIISCLWSMASYLALIILPNDAGRWSFYAAALFDAAAPLFHGMHIAWMASNVAPHGKRILALGAVIGAANICSVPGSQIYQESDSPRFIKGNWAIFGIALSTAVLLLFQHTRYVLTNKYRAKKWNSLTESQKEDYIKNTKAEGSDRLDYQFRI
ncbi:hypothetical protein G6F57_001169 [Rhizopus arrhizus]|uniref:Major facilitator superfamily (MFS) profile domain-containing protein n=1 Tax=Rhizopus oryzae TaxID=64495 RepID=A0A9P6XKB0_RHIOR|nr:hypothetical protein G6F23_001901 [Rhizopus arrhizus]KAG1423048.1 hypothetical protein G6F58_003000 [Rhizopus delemar]KAG0793173.1 hypothetical protein G6F21_003811 [Rhizopus arrhizus]KAG0800126.1 hypothetical protein G6F22_002542 [Rhizopus arrhizus]KAG0815086.1 hypothetical protein G6F20_004261 [Rhizopus arrhizus]